MTEYLIGMTQMAFVTTTNNNNNDTTTTTTTDDDGDNDDDSFALPLLFKNTESQRSRRWLSILLIVTTTMTILRPSYFHNVIFYNGKTLNRGRNTLLQTHIFVFVRQRRQTGWLVFFLSLCALVYDVEYLSVTEFGWMTQSVFSRCISHELIAIRQVWH